MISGRELAFGLMGVWRLIRNDASGLQYFDRSPSGALRSFWVMALVAPAYAVLAMLQLDAYGVPSIGLRQIVLAAGLYVIDWLLFPVILLRLAPIMMREAQVPAYVAAYNWSQVLTYALALFFGAIGGLLPDQISGPLNFVLLGLVAVIQYRLLRHTMNLLPPQAGLLVFAYLSLGVVLNATLYALLMAGKAAV